MSRRELPYISHIGMCRPEGYTFVSRFGLKTVIHFAHFVLESGIVFDGSTGAILFWVLWFCFEFCDSILGFAILFWVFWFCFEFCDSVLGFVILFWVLWFGFCDSVLGFVILLFCFGFSDSVLCFVFLFWVLWFCFEFCVSVLGFVILFWVLWFCFAPIGHLKYVICSLH